MIIDHSQSPLMLDSISWMLRVYMIDTVLIICIIFTRIKVTDSLMLLSFLQLLAGNCTSSIRLLMVCHRMMLSLFHKVIYYTMLWYLCKVYVFSDTNSKQMIIITFNHSLSFDELTKHILNFR